MCVFSALIDAPEDLVSGDLRSDAQLDLSVVANDKNLPRSRTEAAAEGFAARDLLKVRLRAVVRKDPDGLVTLIFFYCEIIDFNASRKVDFLNANARLSFACIE